MNERSAKIRSAIEKLYARFNHKRLIRPDPLQFVYRYAEPADMEIAGFLASVLAYGRVRQIEKSLSRLFECMGESPAEFVRTFNGAGRRMPAGFKHRFTTGEDICDLLELLGGVLKRYGNLETFFLDGYESGDGGIVGACTRFSERLRRMYADEHGGDVSRGLAYLLVSPAGKSACKRMNLFLRWMVRKDNVDSGLWKSIDKARLIVPVDVHMGRLCRLLGLYNGGSISLAGALKITEAFAEIEPADPVKYDFALSRVGIIENCTAVRRAECEFCELRDCCSVQNGSENEA